MSEEQLKQKIAAILHDPPDKPWLLLRGESHEAAVLEYIRSLAGYHEIPERVRLADRLASSVDRLVLSIVLGGRYLQGFMPCEKLVLKNPVNPFFEVELPSELPASGVESYKRRLVSALSSVSDLRLRYLLLFALYESLWIMEGLPVGPADTRVPTHTVFDHNYATATFLNWVQGGGIRGVLAGLDVAGVQRFVASSRKLRDAWTSSYLVSALVWYTVLEIVREIGPDVMVTPSLRNNAFFLHWLFHDVGRSFQGGSGGQVQKLMDSLKEYAFMYDEYLVRLYDSLGIPPYASLPERATLILPPKEELEKILGMSVEHYFETRFREGWRKVWNSLRRYADERSRGGELVWEFIASLFRYYDEEFSGALFHEVPPLLLRVELVEADAGPEDWYVYARTYKELSSRLALRKYRRVEPESELQLSWLTERGFARGLGFPRRSSRGFEYCTSCGKLPAVLVLPSGEGETAAEEEFGFYIYGVVAKKWRSETIEEEWRKIRGGVSERIAEFEEWLRMNDAALRSLKTIFTPGERLCPWCLAKRLLSLEPRLFNVLLLDEDEAYAENLARNPPSLPLSFPSTSDIASQRLRMRLVASEEGIKVAQQLMKELEAEGLQPMLALLRAAARSTRPWRWEIEADEAIDALKTDEGTKLFLKGLLKGDAETLWFSSDRGARLRYTSLLERFNFSRLLWSYYALVLSDGDSVGDLMVGDLSAILNMELNQSEKSRLVKAFLKACGSCDFERLLAALVTSGDETWQRALESWAERLSGQLGLEVEKVRELLSSARKIVEDLLASAAGDQAIIPVSLAYHTSISSALSRAAVLDAIAISRIGGFVIYAGGDDLLALVPVDAAPRLVITSRRIFAGAPLTGRCANLLLEGLEVSPENGFVKVKGAWLPALPGVGKSYAVVVAHFMYPLGIVIRQASSILGDAKERVKVWCDHMGARELLRKDIATFAYSPRGGIEVAFIPQSLSRVIHIVQCSTRTRDYLSELALTVKALDDLLRFTAPQLGGVRYSASLLYDAEEINAHLVHAARQRDYELLEKLVDYVISRNVERGRRQQQAAGQDSGCLEEFRKVLSERGGSKFASCIVEYGEEDKAHLFTLIVRGARFLRGGMR